MCIHIKREHRYDKLLKRMDLKNVAVFILQFLNFF